MKTWVLLRGLARERGHWGRFMPMLQAALGAGERVVALDLPGTGTEHARRSPARIAAIVDDCRERLATKGHRPPYCLFGLSLGGMVAAEWASAYAGEVERCVLVNTSARPVGTLTQRLRPAAWPALLALLARADARRIEGAIHALTSARPAPPRLVDDWADIRRTRPVALANIVRQLLAATRFRLPEAMPAVPVQVLASAADRLVDPDCSRALAARWRAAFALHPSAGHDLPLDDAAWVIAQLTSPDGTADQPRSSSG